MSAPFEKFRVWHGFWNDWNRYTVEVSPGVKGEDWGIGRDEQRRFIEDAIREKLEREKGGRS